MVIDWYGTSFDPLTLPSDLRQAHKFWLLRTTDGRLPNRSAFNILEMPPDILQHTALFELSDDPGSGHGRHWLAGSKLIDLFGGRLGSQNLVESASTSGGSLIEELGEQLNEDRRPIYVILKNVPPMQAGSVLHALILPLELEPDAANLVAMVYQSADE